MSDYTGSTYEDSQEKVKRLITEADIRHMRLPKRSSRAFCLCVIGIHLNPSNLKMIVMMEKPAESVKQICAFLVWLSRLQLKTFLKKPQYSLLQSVLVDKLNCVSYNNL